jgi:multisubunit Na+/H+ antiporter MnhC subunit
MRLFITGIVVGQVTTVLLLYMGYRWQQLKEKS